MALALLMAALLAPSVFAQCNSRVWDTSQPPPHPSWLQPFIPADTQPGFAAQLTSNDWLIAYQFAHEASDKGAFYKGFVIVRDGKVLRDQSLMSAGPWKRTAKSLGYTNMPGFTVQVAQVCQSKQQLVAVAFGVCCAPSSGILFFLATPQHGYYRITALPMTGGGKLEMSQTFPVKLRLWNRKGDGTCDGCPQHYTVTEYSVADGKTTAAQSSTTSRRFDPASFDANRIVLLPVGR